MYGPGFLQSTSTFGGDLNLVLQLGFGALLLVGVVLVRRGAWRAHGACQTVALVATLVLTVVWMAPAFHENYWDALRRGVVNRVSVAVAAHVVVGTLALLLAIWVVLVAGTSLVPPRWRF